MTAAPPHEQAQQQDRPTQDAQDPGNHSYHPVILDLERAVVRPTQDEAIVTADEGRSERRLIDDDLARSDWI